MIPWRLPVMVPLRLPVIVPLRLPVMVPFRLPVIVPLRLPVMVPAKVTVPARTVMSPIPANFLSDFISILLVNDSSAGNAGWETDSAKLPFHPASNYGFDRLNLQ